ncbi:transcription factor bHLH95-like isoform X1 [Vicia villosa]|uniref:transcription factor bHLH95-like isoform X1 n=1 Tax=Vicia villosa TaxID=3911 RepID=UPI00273B8DA8|nr:transcription factor bHLH95-like isoform X1 [Vicia villosa]
MTISENQLLNDLTNSKIIGESSKQKLNMKSLNHKEGPNEGEVRVNKKRSRDKAVIRSENDTNGGGKDEKYRDPDHEMHILTERERRKKMSNMFSSLHDLLPELPSKADKSTIVDGAVTQIKNLQQLIEKLEKEKQEKLKYISLFESEPSSVIKKSNWRPYEPRETIKADQRSLSYNNNLPTAAIVPSYPNSKALSLSAPPSQQVAFQTWTSPNVVTNICGDEVQFSICATKRSGLLTQISFVLEKYMIDVVSASIMCNRNGNFYMIQAHARQGSHDTNLMKEIYQQAAREIMMWIS